MPDNSTLITVSAFSGLAGALATQIINSVNTYFIDKRKQAMELDNQFRTKRLEIGESFYYITGEKMACIKKNIDYWKNWNNARTKKSLEFIYKETFAFNAYMEKLNEDNWKFNLISLYFDVSFTNDEIAKSNAKSHQLYVQYLDFAERIQNADESEVDYLYRRYAVIIFDMCAHYEELYNRLASDVKLIKIQLLNQFNVG